MKPLRVFSCVSVDLESNLPMRFTWNDVAEVYVALTRRKMPFWTHLMVWSILWVACVGFEDELIKKRIPPRYGVRSICLACSLAFTAWNSFNLVGKSLPQAESAFLAFMFKRKYTLHCNEWFIRFLESGGQFFDDTTKKAAIILASIDKHDIDACSTFVEYVNDAISKKRKEDYTLIANIAYTMKKILSLDINKFSITMFENFENALPAWERIAMLYNRGSSLKEWEKVKQQVKIVIEGMKNPRKRPYITDDVKAFIDAANDAGAALVASAMAHKNNVDNPIPARVVDVDKSAGKSLREAIKDVGGRTTKTQGGAAVMTQAEMANSFGEPCNEDMVANWEARAAGKTRGANPPDAIYKGERIIYSAELRTNPTPENKNRLTVLISEYQSRHRIKDATKMHAKTIHCRSDESLYQAQTKHGIS